MSVCICFMKDASQMYNVQRSDVNTCNVSSHDAIIHNTLYIYYIPTPISLDVFILRLHKEDSPVEINFTKPYYLQHVTPVNLHALENSVDI